MKTIVLSLLIMLFSMQMAYSSTAKAGSSLNFDPDKYTTQTLTYKGKEMKVRAYEKIVYVSNPVDTTYQIMNIYIPEEYFNGGSINGYTAQTAPIFFPNQVGGYMPAPPASLNGGGSTPPANGRQMGQRMNGQGPQGGGPGGQGQGGSQGGQPPMGGMNGNRQGGMQDPRGGGMGMPGGNRENAVLVALSKGYVVASAGARGRTNQTTDGQYSGKAPAGLVDLKAAVRYLKYNDMGMPGDANKIISNGTSAGGAMSALLGATGDNPDYLPYLKELGAAEGSDAIFASSDYCPITNLDHADAAYEWQFNGINTFMQRGSGEPSQGGDQSGTSSLSDEQIQVSADLKAQFPAYVNSLGLKDEQGNDLTLDQDGNGSFKEFLKAQVIASANVALKGGTDLSKRTFLTINNGVVTDLNWDEYVEYLERQKTPPAFDGLDLSTPEDIEFGTASINAQHFTDYGLQNSTVANSTKADDQIIKMMNPMNYIGGSNTHTAKFWRIRHGSKDKDTGLAISAILATYLRNHGYVVDYALPWDRPHSGDYDLDELFKWVDSIAK